MDLLRVVAAGSVDDGKSTLIGRLLLDSGAVADDHLDEVQRVSMAAGRGEPDLALLTDGLRAEREQGITIDVAHRYFATDRRAFILADAPGHEQYTRNMVTAASNADLGVLLTDVSRGLTDQTRRHLAVMALMRVPRVMACVNKMDLVDYAEQPCRQIEQELRTVARGHGLSTLDTVPVSARQGDNVVTLSGRMSWYQGPSLLDYLNWADPAPPVRTGLRLPVQLVLSRPHHGRVDRWYAGRLCGGELNVGDRLRVLPGSAETAVRAIRDAGGEVESATGHTSVAVLLTDEVDLSSGGMLASAASLLPAWTSLNADLCWLGEQPVKAGTTCFLRHCSQWTRSVVQEVRHRTDIRTGALDSRADRLALNEIGAVRCELAEPVFADPYQVNRMTGNFVLVDEFTSGTVGAGMIRHGW